MVAKKAEAKVQDQIEQETEQGFRGQKVDPTPNENYTAAGVTSGKPTPESDPEYAAKVRAELA